MQRSGLIVVCTMLAGGFLAAGCTGRAVEYWNSPHEFEGEAFGDTNRQIYARQIVDPDPAKPTAEDAAVDGVRTHKAITDYKTREVSITKTGGSGGGGGGSPTSAKVAAPAK